jgi:hypothetical protein
LFQNLTENALFTQPDTAELAVFFLSARAKFEEAVHASGLETCLVQVADHLIRLHFAGSALKPHVTRALQHNAVAAEGRAEFTIHLWDAESTGVCFPAAPWRHDGFVRRGEIEGLHSDRIHVALEAGFGGCSLLDEGRDEAIFFTPSWRTVPYYDSAAPLRSILSWWLTRRGLQLVHGGAVGIDGAGVLLAGKGGSGKSTTALLCVEDGMSYASDDYSVLQLEPGPRAFGLYNSAKIRPQDLARFPHLFPNAQSNRGDEKRHLFVAEHYPERVASHLALRAILLPRVIGHGTTRLAPATPAAALMALAPSTIFQLPGAGSAAFEFLSRLVRGLPAYALELGQSTGDVAPAIRRFLS